MLEIPRNLRYHFATASLAVLALSGVVRSPQCIGVGITNDGNILDTSRFEDDCYKELGRNIADVLYFMEELDQINNSSSMALATMEIQISTESFILLHRGLPPGDYDPYDGRVPGNGFGRASLVNEAWHIRESDGVYLVMSLDTILNNYIPIQIALANPEGIDPIKSKPVEVILNMLVTDDNNNIFNIIFKRLKDSVEIIESSYSNIPFDRHHPDGTGELQNIQNSTSPAFYSMHTTNSSIECIMNTLVITPNPGGPSYSTTFSEKSTLSDILSGLLGYKNLTDEQIQILIVTIGQAQRMSLIMQEFLSTATTRSLALQKTSPNTQIYGRQLENI